MQRLHDRRVINAAYQVTGHDLQCISILLGPAGPAILRFAQHEPPGALLSYVEKHERRITCTPSMAHTLCALARWRWMVVHMICYHGVPAIDSWPELFNRQNIVRMLPDNELDEAIRVIEGEMSERFNVTIRWHESHFEGCPYCCDTAAQIAVPQAPAPCLPGSAPVRRCLTWQQ